VGFSAGVALVVFVLPLGRLAFLRRRGRAVGSGRRVWRHNRLDGIDRRRARVLRGGCLRLGRIGWDVILALRLDADGFEAGAGDPERGRVVAPRGAPVLDQALGLKAAEHFVNGAALDPERIGQRQDGTVVSLRGGAEDHGLGVAELGHG
jgi:hypothetical protein